MLSETTDQGHCCSDGGSKERSDSSDSETSDDDDDDDDDDSDSSSSSSDSSVTDSPTALTDRDKVDCVGIFSGSDSGKTRRPLTVSDSSLVIENGAAAAAAAAAEPAELIISNQLSSLTVSDKQHITSDGSELPQSDADLVQQ